MTIPIASFLPYLILAIIGFLIGLFIARLIWRSSRADVEAAEREADRLETDQRELEREIKQLEREAA